MLNSKKKIFFPVTNRVHEARQQILLKKLAEHFVVEVRKFEALGGTMADRTAQTTEHFYQQLKLDKPDIMLVRGDRFEMLPVAMLAAYMGIPIAHIEGGDLSGAIDNKVRYAITHLSDIHFTTNEESRRRIIVAGMPVSKVHNVGSLDVEYAASIQTQSPFDVPYIVIAYHPIPGEVLPRVENFGNHVVVIDSNSDYGQKMRGETYTAENYISLLAHASCLVGNSSSLLKEASIFGTPVVMVGSRQGNRLKPHNVLSVPCDSRAIELAVQYQLAHGKYEPSHAYYQENTSDKIVQILCNTAWSSNI